MNPSRKIRFLIAYGPTEEPIDPVRYLSNRSTGTMGRFLVDAARKRGHTVTAIQCPRDVRTARELEATLRRLLPRNDVLIMAAAVCDARPAVVAKVKIKKDALTTIRLVKNPDILAGLAAVKKKGQVFIGFGLESKDLLKNGLKKLKSKSLDLIVLQQVTEKQDPFGDKKIEAVILSKDSSLKRFPTTNKRKIAEFIVREAVKLNFKC
jgi:phosphopantothenoylcysteine decarboxylase / phosphopantothenate---cysteine ligase